MGKFKRDNRDDGRKKFGGGGFRRDDRGEAKTMFKTTCSECGKRCEVPFKPTGEKPVFCSTCFSEREGTGGDRRVKQRNDRRDHGRSGGGDRQMYKAVCDECHRDCEVPFKPSSDKPVYCSDCFDKNGRDDRGPRRDSGSGRGTDYKKDFESLNAKLDEVIALLSKTINEKEPTEKKEKKEVIKKKAVKKEEKKPARKKKEAAPKKTAKKKVEKKTAVKKKK